MISHNSVSIIRNLFFISLILLLSISPAFATHPGELDEHEDLQTPSFEAWLAAFRQEALVKGISEKTLNTVLPSVKPIPRVIELDRNQPEFKLTFDQYLSRVAPPFRVKLGRKLLKMHKGLLNQIRAKYGVQPRYIVALWGMETDFGRLTGGFNAINALATLAYDGRRSKYFRGQLINAFLILDKGHVTYKEMLGSWAGAMGQTQFMPSTFLSYAVDFNNDGKINLWKDKEDALASGANYLSQVGWYGDQTWGREVQLPDDFNANLASLDIKKDISEWQVMGVRRINGKDLPTRKLDASIIRVDDNKGRAFMVYDNYRAIMDWNRSTSFATAVGILSDRIANVKK